MRLHKTKPQQTTYTAEVTTGDKDWSKELREDIKVFSKVYPDEMKAVQKAVLTIAYRQKGSIFNFGGSVEIDKSALAAYVMAKESGATCVEAVRARNAVYLAEAENILESKKK